MAEQKPNTSVLQAGNLVRIELSGPYQSLIAAKGGISLWPEKEALSSDVTTAEPDRFWIFLFDDAIQATAFIAEHHKKVAEADALLATSTTTPEVP